MSNTDDRCTTQQGDGDACGKKHPQMTQEIPQSADQEAKPLARYLQAALRYGGSNKPQNPSPRPDWDSITGGQHEG